MPRDAKRKTILPFSGSLQSMFKFLAIPVFVIVLLTTYIIHKNKSSSISLKDNNFYVPFVTSDQSITSTTKYFIIWQIQIRRNPLEINNLL